MRLLFWVIVVVFCFLFVYTVCFASSGPGADRCVVAKDRVVAAVGEYYQFQEELVDAAVEAQALGYSETKIMRMKADWIDRAEKIEEELRKSYESVQSVCP